MRQVGPRQRNPFSAAGVSVARALICPTSGRPTPSYNIIPGPCRALGTKASRNARNRTDIRRDDGRLVPSAASEFLALTRARKG